MRLSTQGRTALAALIDIAIHSSNHPVPSVAVCSRIHMSKSYVDALFVKLGKSCLVKGSRGPGGGYVVAKPLSAISVLDVIAAVDDDDDHEHGKAGPAAINELWENISAVTTAYLRGITLDDLVAASQQRIDLANGVDVF